MWRLTDWHQITRGHVYKKATMYLCIRSSRVHFIENNKQGCGAGAQISDSGSRHLNFLAPSPERFGPVKTKNHCFICATRLPNKQCRWTGTQISGSGSTALITGTSQQQSIQDVTTVRKPSSVTVSWRYRILLQALTYDSGLHIASACNTSGSLLLVSILSRILSKTPYFCTEIMPGIEPSKQKPISLRISWITSALLGSRACVTDMSSSFIPTPSADQNQRS